MHFELLRQPLVADLLHPQSSIGAEGLAPTLLSETEEALAAALQMFDLEQLSQLYADAERCLNSCRQAPAGAAERLAQIAGQLSRVRQQLVQN